MHILYILRRRGFSLDVYEDDRDFNYTGYRGKYKIVAKRSSDAVNVTLTLEDKVILESVYYYWILEELDDALQEFFPIIPTKEWHKIYSAFLKKYNYTIKIVTEKLIAFKDDYTIIIFPDKPMASSLRMGVYVRQEVILRYTLLSQFPIELIFREYDSLK